MRRLGFHASGAQRDPISVPLPLTLNLGGECRSLLGYDGNLVAISHSGAVTVAEPGTSTVVCRFQAHGPVTAQPSIHDGVLYLAAGNQLSAYSLGPLTTHQPHVRTLWTLPLSATPIHAVTLTGARLYVTVASSAWREVQIVEHLQRPALRTVHGATRVSWLAADPSEHTAVFFSQNDGESVQLHVASGSTLAAHAMPLQQVPEQPIAVIGRTAFGVFGDEHRLYRIDTAAGAVEEPLGDDIQFFALSHASDEEWDRESVTIDNDGITFSAAGIRDAFGPLDRAVKGSPLIVRDSAALVGMDDGRVRLYNLARLPRHEVWRVGGSASPITALAAFGDFIAAGNREGVVEVRQLRAKGPSA